MPAHPKHRLHPPGRRYPPAGARRVVSGVRLLPNSPLVPDGPEVPFSQLRAGFRYDFVQSPAPDGAPEVARKAGGRRDRWKRRMIRATDDELAALTEILGERPVVPTFYVPNLVEELDQPKLSPKLIAFAGNHGLDDETSTRRYVAEMVIAKAARHRSPGSKNWEAQQLLGMDASVFMEAWKRGDFAKGGQ